MPMSTLSIYRMRLPRHTALVACLAAALGVASSVAIAGPNQAMHRERAAQWTLPHVAADMVSAVPAYLRVEAARAQAAKPYHPNAMDHLVTSCLDDGSPGTLRSVIADPTTVSGDSINLAQVMCSK